MVRLTLDQPTDYNLLESQSDTERARELVVELGKIADELGKMFGALSNPAYMARDAARAVDRQLAIDRQAALNNQHGATTAPESRLDVRKSPRIR